MNARLLPFLALSALAACATAPPPLYEGLGDCGRAVSTDAALAQEYFDQGLALCWGFNHDEALRSFDEAVRLDPDCAMLHWGRAYVLGPDINRGIENDDVARAGYAAARRALALADGATPVERALIEAMTERFADPPPEDRGELDQAYADAMREVWRRFPEDPLVGILFADSLMNVSKDWRAFGTDEERGPNTPEIVATLERVLEMAPNHPGACHFYIHAVEGSNTPGRALAAANRLEGLMPAAGHLVHMPSHIYIRVGMYDEALASNARAVQRDDEFFAQAPRQGVYHLYRAHNHHFLSWAAMFQGSRAAAMEAARDMVSKLPSDYDAGLPAIDSYRFVPMHVMMRFGEWENMLAEPPPGERFLVATALWHHGRGVAYANTQRLPEAREELARFDEAAARVPDTTVVRRARITDLIALARGMMLGEILFREGDHPGAFASLREAISIEDSLPYSEPPGWMQPVRHSLGALLLEDGRVEEAEAVYRADLDRYANNVWSLHGLAECLRREGRAAEAMEVEARLAEASKHADVEIRSSCFCRILDPTEA